MGGRFEVGWLGGFMDGVVGGLREMLRRWGWDGMGWGWMGMDGDRDTRGGGCLYLMVSQK